MNKNNVLVLFFLICLVVSCKDKQQNYLTKISRMENAIEASGYINQKGDTIVPIGYYVNCLTDTIRKMGVVLTQNHEFVAINQNGEPLFEVYPYDNGPDYISDGLFRIIKDKKIGFADKDGTIVITPQFECASPFENGESKVAHTCQLIDDGEHSIMESDDWIYIDKKGKEIRK